MSSSILSSVQSEKPEWIIAPWKWGNVQIGAFQCDFVEGLPTTLELSSHVESESKIYHEAFGWAVWYRKPCDLVGQALRPAIHAYESKGIRTDQFSDDYPLRMWFCKRTFPVPWYVVVSTGGVPVVGYNTSEDFRKIGTKPDCSDPRPGREFSDETVRAMNMTIIIALAQRQARGMDQGCIEPKEVIEVATIYVPCQAKTIHIYTAKVTRAYLLDLKDPETPFTNTLTITKTVLSCADPKEAVSNVLRFIMASVSKIKVLKELHNVGSVTKPATRRVISTSSGPGPTKAQVTK